MKRSLKEFKANGVQTVSRERKRAKVRVINN